MTDVSEVQATLERGRRLVVVAPPAVEHAGAVWELTASTGPTVVVCADHAAAVEWVALAPPGRRVHAVTGLARSARILASGPCDVVAGAAKDLAALVTQSALKLETIGTLVVAWPEALAAGEHGATLDGLLAEAREARRIVLTWNPDALADFLERHAHRAPLLGAPARGEDGRPAPPVGPARFAVASPGRQTTAARDALDALQAERAVLWRRDTPLPAASGDAVVCLDLPSRDELATLLPLGPVVLLVTAAQLPYARTIAAPLTPVPTGGAADRALDRAEALQTAVARTLASRSVDGELAMLAPLFERFDPAEVAAALLALAPTPPEPATAPRAGAGAHKWERLFINVGKRDRASAKDLVGALIREAGLSKEDIGKIEVRDAFSLCELAPAAIERATARLSGSMIRGRRLAPRRDRG